MARRIVDSGFPLTLWARRPETLQPFANTPASFASTPAALAEASSIACVCVTSDQDVEDVVLGPHGVLAGLPAHTTLIIHSTVHPNTCVRLSERAGAQGVALLDAPVSGGGEAASQGSLLVMVGGDASVLARVQPVLATYGNPVLHLGGVGAGQIAKLANNLVFAAQMALATDAFSFVDQLGLDRSMMAQVLERGSGSSRAAVILSGSGFDLGGLGQIAGPLLQKDVGLIVDVAQQLEAVPPPALLGLARAALALLTPDIDGVPPGSSDSGHNY